MVSLGFPEASLCSSEKDTVLLTLSMALPLGPRDPGMTSIILISFSNKANSLIGLGPICGRGRGTFNPVTSSKALFN